MGRPVVLSNGRLFVGLDENGLVNDFYYPYVGQDNLTDARSTQHKIGVWYDGQFSWLTTKDWEVSVTMEDAALISTISYHSAERQLQINFADFVDPETDAFVRRITIQNLADTERDVRVFMHQVFRISQAGRADTAFYVPGEAYIMDYKGHTCLGMSGKLTSGESFDQYAVGNYGIEGKSGTFLDAEDGELSGNNVEHGGVDSVLRFSLPLEAHASAGVDYWVAAASDQTALQQVNDILMNADMEQRITAVRQHWATWLAPSRAIIDNLPDDQRVALQKSLLIIKAHCDERGSVLASGDSSIFNYGRDYYCYCWPRDASYAVWPLIRLGIYDEALRFFDFARDTMQPDGYLAHKYQPDRSIGSTWHPLVHGKNRELAIQEDETASVVHVMAEYYKQSGDEAFVQEFYDSFIVPAANFMVRFIDIETGLPHASYDLWEQKFLTSTYTVATVIAGLLSAADLSVVMERPEDTVRWRQAAASIRANLPKLYNTEGGYFRKGFSLQDDSSLVYDDTVDASNLYGPFMFATLTLDDGMLAGTAAVVEKQLLNTSPVGGVIRYPGDGYFLAKQQYGGNPWVVCTAWMAQYYAAHGRAADAAHCLQWMLDRRAFSGVLSEQFDPEDGFGMSVTPLVWSHAELINTILDLTQPAE